MEASQQSRRDQVPQVLEPVRFSDALSSSAAVRLFLDEEGTGTPMLKSTGVAASYAILAGPEGGWTDSERNAAAEAEWIPVTLGAGILRAETAAIAALSVLRAVITAG